jgi:hypothetical protein
VVDDFLPCKVGKNGKLNFPFSKSTDDEKEIWVMLLEKAIAKIHGSYEAIEDISAEDSFQYIVGGPSLTYQISEYKVDIARGDSKEERLDKLWNLIDFANKKGWVITV